MKKILILGGGFGGVRCALDCARKLNNKDVSITLIDRNAYHTFTPSLYEIASAYQPTDDPFALELRRAVAIPYKDIFEGLPAQAGKKIDFIQSEIVSVDPTASHVVLSSGTQISFDYLVLALGSQTADFGIPGVYDYAYQFKTTDDAVALHNKLETSFQMATQGRVSLPIKFFVIGAGFTGIELAAELMLCARKLSKRYGLNRRSFSTILFEAGSSILPTVKESERKKIINRLTDLGVVVMTDSHVENVLSDSVKLKTGQTVKGTTVIWTAGVQANKLIARIPGLPVTDKRKITVDKNLRVINSENIFALGDCIEFIDSETLKPVPCLAYVAQAQGSIIAKNLHQVIYQKKLYQYFPRYDYWITPVGGKFVVAHLGGLGSYSGFLGWLIRMGADLRYFLSILSFSKTIKLFGRDVLLFSKND